MRLSCRILDDGSPLGTDSGKNGIYRAADGHAVKINACARYAVFCLRVYETAVYGNLRAQRLKSLDMLIYRARAEVAASRKSHHHAPEAPEHGTDEII